MFEENFKSLLVKKKLFKILKYLFEFLGFVTGSRDTNIMNKNA